MYKLKGMIPAITTPFNKEGSIDFEALKCIIDFMIEGGMHSVLVGGSTGEFIYLTKEERKELFKKSCDIADGRVPIMAATGCNRLEDTIELTQHAAKVGATSALILPPFYSSTSDEGVIDYYKAIAEASSIGIVIYNNPFQINVSLEPELIYEISKIKNVIGIKNTWDSIIHTMKIIDLTRDNENFGVMTGIEQLIIPTLVYGGAGAVGLIHDLKPKEVRDIYDAIVREKDVDKAVEIYREIVPIVDMIDEDPSPRTIKAALDIMGMPGGPLRFPLLGASEDQIEKIKSVL